MCLWELKLYFTLPPEDIYFSKSVGVGDGESSVGDSGDIAAVGLEPDARHVGQDELLSSFVFLVSRMSRSLPTKRRKALEARRRNAPWGEGGGLFPFRIPAKTINKKKEN